MTGDQARAVFAGERIARLATVDAVGRPHLVPVVFALAGDTLVFAVDHKPKASARLKRLDNIRAAPAVCLLADGYDEDWERLWWVRADGMARVLPPGDPAGTGVPDAYVRLLTDKYRAQYADRPPAGPVVESVIGRWSGWRAG